MVQRDVVHQSLDGTLPTGGRSRYTSVCREIVRSGIADGDEGDFDAIANVERVYPLDRIELLHGLFSEAD